MAPGRVSITYDRWTADTMRKGFLRVTMHWISVENGHWTLESAVIGFQSILGRHDGENLG
jgi:hypothetical protein